MAKSALTYQGALALLGRQDHPLLEKLDTLLGGAILAGTVIWGQAAWAFIDPKSELIAITRTLLDKGKQRALGTSGHNRRQLLNAAHTVLTISAFFDGVADVLGPHSTSLELTDKEKLRITNASVDEPTFVQELLSLEIPLPLVSQRIGDHIGIFFHSAAGLVDFASGLAVADRVLGGTDKAQLTQHIVDRAAQRYDDAYLRFAVDVPEFALWISWTSDDRTRDLLQSTHSDIVARLAEHSIALSKLHDLLALTASGNQPGPRSHRELLATAAKSVLNKPLLRSSTRDQSTVSFPTVEHGFVAPRFRAAVYGDGDEPAQESWWEQVPVDPELDEFLASHLATTDSTELPLLILGHPGAGKSLLTEVLAAQLPENAYTVVRVPLRDVDPTKAIHEQISDAMSIVLKQSVDWGQLTEECQGTIRVVILDGFDELVLATGVTQTAYLDQVARFQQEELDLGRPVAVIVTSRTLVADRARIPHGTLMIKLEEFEDDQIEVWLGKWNLANGNTRGFRALEPAEVTAQRDLACQPLLLLILAIYAAESGQRLDSQELSGASLYRKLLDSFIRRQVEDKSPQQLTDRQIGTQMAERRWQLSVAAFGMFNRGLQHISDVELEADLTPFRPATAARERSSFDHPMTEAERTISSFFFIEDSQAREGRHTYEFLHSTFAEYLIAESTMTILGGLADQYGSSAGGFPGRSDIQDDALAALLSHQPLVKRTPIVDFTLEIYNSFDPNRSHNVMAVLDELLRSARTNRRQRQYDRYEPTPYDAIHRLACYTANLATLRITLTSDDLSPHDLAPEGIEPMPWWESMVNLWESGLDVEGWNNLLDTFTLSYDEPPVFFSLRQAIPVGPRERLLGRSSDVLLIAAGAAVVGRPGSVTSEADGELNLTVVQNLIPDVATGPLARLLPADEQVFVDITARLAAGQKLTARVHAMLWQSLARAAKNLPFAVVDALTTQLVANQEEEWSMLGSGPACIVAAHPRILLTNESVTGYIGRILDRYPVDGMVAVSILYEAEQTATEPEITALSTLRSDFDRFVANLQVMLFFWFVPEFLTYLRLEQPAYWSSFTALLDELSSQSSFELSRVAPIDALYLARAAGSAQSEDFLKRFLHAHGQPAGGLRADELLDRLAAYAELPWERP